MSFINCITELGVEGVISKEKQISLEEIYNTELLKAINSGASEEAAKRLAGKATFESFQYKANLKKRHISLQEKADVKARKYILEEFRDMKGEINPAKAFEHIIGFMASPEGTGRFLNVETRIKYNIGQIHKEMYDFLEKFRHTVIGATRNKATLKLVGEEIFSPGSTGNKNAQELAEALNRAMELSRKMFNEAGGSIPKINGTYVPQMHSQVKVGGISAKEWIDFVTPMLDREKMINYQTGVKFGDEELRIALGEAYNNIITNGYLTKTAGTGKKMLANSKLDHRFIHFKDYTSWETYHGRFGDGDLFGITMGHLDKMSRDISFLQVMGPNPEGFLKRLSSDINQWANLQPADKLLKAQNQARSKIQSTTNLYHYLTGDLNVPVSATYAKNMASIRNIATASYLGSAAILALGDFNLTRQQAALTGMPQFRAMRKNLQMFLEPYAANRAENSTRMRIAVTSGMAAEHWSTLASSMARYSADNVESHEVSRRIADIVLRTTQLSWLTQAGRWGAGMEFTAYTARAMAQSFDQIKKADPKFAEYLEAFGIRQTEWDIIRQTKAYDAGADDPKWKGALYLRADDIAQRTDISPDLARELAYKIGHAQQEFVNYSVPVASAKSATVISGSTRPGTHIGELAKAILQFKQFPLVFSFTHIAQGLMRKTVKGKMGYLLPLLVGTTFMGMLSHELKNITKGKNISTDEQYNNPQYYLNALLHGGGLGFAGDILFGGRYSMDSTAGRGAELLGPVPGLIFQGLDLTFGNIYQGLDPNKEMNLGGDVSRFIKNNTPGGSAWYMRLLLERYLFEYMQEIADPKYQGKINRKIKRTEREERNSYWWQPGEKSPQSAPSIFD